MSIQEILSHVEFIVDSNGKPKSAVLDMKTWETFVAWLKAGEDSELVQKSMAGWRKKEDWQSAKRSFLASKDGKTMFPLIKSEYRRNPLTDAEVKMALAEMDEELDIENANLM